MVIQWDSCRDALAGDLVRELGRDALAGDLVRELGRDALAGDLVRERCC
jgi:hypothetical protein